QEEEARCARIAPLAHVVAQPADRMKYGTACLRHRIPIIMPERRRILPKSMEQHMIGVVMMRVRLVAALGLFAVFAALPAHAAERYGEGLLWRIDGKGAPASHVFGTIHLADSRVTTLPPAVDREFRQSRSLTIEAGLDPGNLVALVNRMIYS